MGDCTLIRLCKPLYVSNNQGQGSLTMTGFLRKKHKPPQPPQSTDNAAPPPLFSRFASKAQEPQRTIVSSPMVLSSARSQNRGSRVIRSEAGPQRRPGSTAMKSQETVNDFGREPRARPTPQKPLPLPAESQSPAASTSYLPPYRSNSPDIAVAGEYAHLWSVIAGNDSDHQTSPKISQQYNNSIYPDTASATSPHPTPQHIPPPNMSPPAQKIPAPVPRLQPPPSFSSLNPDHDLSSQTFAPPSMNQPQTRHHSPADLHRPSPSELGGSRSSLTLISPKKHPRANGPADDHVFDSRPAQPTNGVQSSSSLRVSIPSFPYLPTQKKWVRATEGLTPQISLAASAKISSCTAMPIELIAPHVMSTQISSTPQPFIV